MFLGGAILLCALWLWLRPPLPSEAVTMNGAPRPARVERSSITLDTAILERYVGKYEGRQNFTVDLTLKNGRLFAESPGVLAPFELLATSETHFFLRGGGVDLEFRVENGIVDGFAATTDFGVVLMDRIR